MECGECTLCCTVFPIKWLNKPKYTDCVHCVLKKGCNIHSTKENECSDFNCAYVQMEKVNINLRPDKCGIIFEKVSDNIFFGSLHPDYPITEIAKNQVKVFNMQGFSVILSSPKEKKPLILLADNHIGDEIEKEFQKIVKK